MNRFFSNAAFAEDDKGNVMAESMDLVEMERRITFPGSGKLSCISEAGILVLKTDTFARCIAG